MNYEQLLALIDKLDHSTLAYLKYDHAGDVVELAKDVPKRGDVIHSTHTAEASKVSDFVMPHASTSHEPESTRVPEVSGLTEGTPVVSPMVGVVYLQPSPEDDPYVTVGDKVNAGDTVVLIEAMKLMTEIKADRSGIVTEILVTNEDLVEFDQPLIRIKEEV